VLPQETEPSSREPRTDAERHNSTRWINRLPVELLSRIFITGDELDQLDDHLDKDTINSDDSEKDEPEFQEIVVVGAVFDRPVEQ
jgi:hypothetical protein